MHAPDSSYRIYRAHTVIAVCAETRIFVTPVPSLECRHKKHPRFGRVRLRSTSTVPVLTFYKSLAISIQPSRNIHAEHPQHKSSREHVQIVQYGSTYQPGYSVDDGENNNDGNSIASDCTHGQPAFHLPPR